MALPTGLSPRRKMAPNEHDQRPPIHSHMQPDHEMGPVERLVVDGAPSSIIQSEETQGRKGYFRDHEARCDLQNHKTEQKPIQQVVDTSPATGPGNNGLRSSRNPIPREEQMEEDDGDKGEPNPFVDWQTGEPWGKEQQYGRQKADVEIQREAGTGKRHAVSARLGSRSGSRKERTRTGQMLPSDSVSIPHGAIADVQPSKLQPDKLQPIAAQPPPPPPGTRGTVNPTRT